MKELEKEFQELIKKNLPAQVGETLNEILQQAKKDSEKVKDLSEIIVSKDSTINGLNKMLAIYKEHDERNKGLEERETAVTERERLAEIANLTFQLNTEKEKSKFVSDVTMGLVRNTEYRKTIFDNQSDNAGRDQYGNPVYVNKTQNSDENKSAS